jgi:predicted acyl esterase
LLVGEPSATVRPSGARVADLRVLLKPYHDPHPWDDMWQATDVEHPVRDEWWDERNLVPLLDRVQVPAYVGCDYTSVTSTSTQRVSPLSALSNVSG